MRRLSDEQAVQINRDKQRINMGRSLDLPKSMSYSGFVNLLKEYGVSKVADYFGCSKEEIPEENFSIDNYLDLSIILSYWKLRYDETEEIYLPDMLEKMNKEYFMYILRDDPVEVCVRERYRLSKVDYNSLSDEDRNRMRKEIEDDNRIIYTYGCIFFYTKENCDQ
jgi:hypothetical protein